jgi:uncharacterized protein YbcV (DUF1398 family)
LKSEIGLAERIENPCVGGSIPPRATKKHQNHLRVVFILARWIIFLIYLKPPMNPNTTEVIKKCAHESHAGLLTFPEVLSRLMTVGVESYFADYRNQATTYYLSSNEAYVAPMEMPSIEIPTTFNKEGVVSAIRGAQSDVVRYPEFLKLTMSAGCIGYIVWITGKHVNYFGRQGELHPEYFPKG